MFDLVTSKNLGDDDEGQVRRGKVSDEEESSDEGGEAQADCDEESGYSEDSDEAQVGRC